MVKIPLQSITDGDTVAYEVETGAKYVIIPHLKFSSGNDTRDYVLYDRVFHEEETDPAKKYTNEPFVENRDGNYTTYVNAYVNGYIRYKVDRSVDGNGETELKAAILRLTHNNVQYVAQVDKEHFDHEYITIDNEKHYFTRFYTISYDGIAANAKDEEGNDVLNVPKVRYMLGKDETTIDLSKIIFYTQEGISNNVLKLGGTNYISNMFKFYVDDGSEESSEIEFSKDDAGNNIWTISCESNNKFSPINIMIKDTTGKFVVGRLTILPTVETSTIETESNKTIFIEAGDTTKVDYAIGSGALGTGSYQDAMSNKPFTGTISEDHKGWTNYVYDVSSVKYKDANLSIDNNGQISDLSGQAPWGDITVEARLKYAKETELANTIEYSTWSKLFFGENKISYAELLGQNLAVKTYKQTTDAANVEIDSITDNGDIVVPYGDYTIQIALGQICPCGEFVKLGKTCTYLDMTELKTEPSKIYKSLDELGAYENYFSFLNANKEITIPNVGKVTLDGTLTQGENGQWTLSENGKISLFEFGVEKSFTASNLVKTTKTEEFDVVDRKIVLPNGAKNPKIADESLTFVYDDETSTLTFDESVDLTGISKVSVTYEIAIIIENAEKEQKIQKYNLAETLRHILMLMCLNLSVLRHGKIF